MVSLTNGKAQAASAPQGRDRDPLRKRNVNNHWTSAVTEELQKPNNLMPGSHDALEITSVNDEQPSRAGVREAGRRTQGGWEGKPEQVLWAPPALLCTQVTRPPPWRATQVTSYPGSPFIPLFSIFSSLPSVPPPSIEAALAGRAATPYRGWELWLLLTSACWKQQWSWHWL